MKQTIDIEAIRKRCEAATPGPWRITGANNNFVYVDTDNFMHGIICEIYSGRAAFAEPAGETKANIDFIAASREDIPALLDALEDSKNVYTAIIDRIVAERNAAIARAEEAERSVKALERAIRTHYGLGDAACGCCAHQEENVIGCAFDDTCGDESIHWKFDEERFAG